MSTDPMSCQKALVKKEKCMSKNAILARANRQRKKMEIQTMANEIKDLKNQLLIKEQKIVSLTKELEDKDQNVKYLRSLLQNMPELAILVEHMGTKILLDE